MGHVVHVAILIWEGKQSYISCINLQWAMVYAPVVKRTLYCAAAERQFSSGMGRWKIALQLHTTIAMAVESGHGPNFSCAVKATASVEI